MNIIGKTISETRKLKGLTQEELAEKSKVNLRTIQRIENNQNQPRGKTLELICDVLQIEKEQLLNQEQEKQGKKVANSILNGLFLLLFNLLLMLLLTYLTIDSKANINSRLGAFLLSFFIPFFLVYFTPKMKQTERVLKFGLGFVIVFFTLFCAQGFPRGLYVGTSTGFYLCMIVAIGVLFYGDRFLNLKKV